MNILQQVSASSFNEMDNTQKALCYIALNELQSFSWLTPYLLQKNNLTEYRADVDGLNYLIFKQMVADGQIYFCFMKFIDWAIPDDEISRWDGYESRGFKLSISEDRYIAEDGVLTLKNDLSLNKLVYDEKNMPTTLPMIDIKKWASIPIEIGTTEIEKTVDYLNTTGYVARLPYLFTDKLDPMIAIIANKDTLSL